jgi:hypothetical protein
LPFRPHVQQGGVSALLPVAESRGFDHSDNRRLFGPIRLLDSIAAAAVLSQRFQGVPT